MLPYNIDFFDYNGIFIANVNADEITIETDYISGGDNELKLIYTNDLADVRRGGYLKIQRTGVDEVYFGYITGVTKDSVNYSTINVKWCDILNLFSVQWCIDTDVQHSGKSLEVFIAEQMALISEQVFTVNNVTGIKFNFSMTSSTTDWGFNLKSDVEGQHSIIINFFDTIIQRSLKEYNVAIVCTPVFSSSISTTRENITINVSIGTMNTSPIVIEADVATVIYKSLLLHNEDESVNRLRIYNEEDFTQYLTFYRDENGNVYNSAVSTDEYQMFPVNFKAISLSSETGFEASALAEAKAEFLKSAFIDLLELEITNNDTLVNPLDLNITTLYTVIFEGVQYQTILTGKKIKEGTTLLTFGTNRVDLTKILRKVV